MTDPRPPLAYLAFRLLFAPIFLVAGLKHLLSPQQVALRLENAPLGHLATALAPAEGLVVAAGLVLFVAGTALLLGLKTRVAAVALAAVLVPITVTVQVGNPEGVGPLLKNLALLGGLVQFAMAGAGFYSLDGRWNRHTRTAVAIGAAALALLVAPVVRAAGQSPAPRERVAFLVQGSKPLKVVLQTARQMLEGKDFPASEVTVVVCGEAAGAIAADGEQVGLARAAHEAGVRVAACGLTLKEKGIDPASLAAGVVVVPNGLIEVLRLQVLGYRTVEL